MTRPRDSQRSRLFTAEASLTDALQLHNETATRNWFRDHVTGSFWTRRIKEAASALGLPPRFVERWQNPRVGFRKGSQRCYPDIIDGVLWVSNDSTVFTVIHQLAHLLTWSHEDDAWHGRLFAKTYLELTRKFLGEEWYQKVKAAYATHGVKRNFVSEETRQLRRDAWYEREAREAPKQLAAMIAELEAAAVENQ